MATILGKQVSAYHDSVIDASREADVCRDAALEPVQEAVLMALGLVAAIGAVMNHTGAGRPEGRQEWVGVCRSMLQSMTSLTVAFQKLREQGIQVAGLPEFRQATTDVRLLMADLLKAGESTAAPKPETAGAMSVKAFADLARDRPAPQSWYDEDFGGLRGPVAHTSGAGSCCSGTS